MKALHKDILDMTHHFTYRYKTDGNFFRLFKHRAEDPFPGIARVKMRANARGYSAAAAGIPCSENPYPKAKVMKMPGHYLLSVKHNAWKSGWSAYFNRGTNESL